MTCYKLLKNSTLIVALGIFIATAIGCSNKDADPSQATTPVSSHSQSGFQIVKDNGLTKEITNESEIVAGQVYMQESDKMVIGTLVAKKGTNKKAAQELAQKYADKIRQKYKNKKVIVYAVSIDRKLLAQVN
jgi:predicted RNA-binding protein Jag